MVVSPSWRDRPAWRLIGPRLSRHEDCHDRPNVLRPAPASLLPLPLTYYCLGYMRKICSISIRKIENNKSYFSKKNRFSGPVHRPAGHENPFTRTGLSSSPLFLKSWYFQWQLAAWSTLQTHFLRWIGCYSEHYDYLVWGNFSIAIKKSRYFYKSFLQ